MGLVLGKTFDGEQRYIKSENIIIDLLDTGLNEIKVTDDGLGMSKDDVLMCFKRHATSKIKTSHDLYHISTLGFRGEAIPSIASVSHMEIISSEGVVGYRILLKNGKTIEEVKTEIDEL